MHICLYVLQVYSFLQTLSTASAAESYLVAQPGAILFDPVEKIKELSLALQESEKNAAGGSILKAMLCVISVPYIYLLQPVMYYFFITWMCIIPRAEPLNNDFCAALRVALAESRAAALLANAQVLSEPRSQVH